MLFDERPDLAPLLDDEHRGVSSGEHTWEPLGLDVAERAVLAAVLNAPLSWSVVEIAEDRKPALRKMFRRRRVRPAEVDAWIAGLLAGGHDGAVIDRLIAAGWLDPWKTREGREVTLSVRAASAIGVTLIEPWHDGLSQWTTPGDPRFRMPVRLREVAQRATAQDDDALLLNLVDPAPGPEQAAIDAEEYLMRQKVDPETGKPLIDLHTGKPLEEAVTILGAKVRLSRAKRARSGKKTKKSKGKAKKKVKAT